MAPTATTNRVDNDRSYKRPTLEEVQDVAIVASSVPTQRTISPMSTPNQGRLTVAIQNTIDATAPSDVHRSTATQVPSLVGNDLV